MFHTVPRRTGLGAVSAILLLNAFPAQSQGTITTFAGNGNMAFSGDGGLATAASLFNPTGLAIDSAGGVYIADMGNSRVRRVSPVGIISTIAGNGTNFFSGDGNQATSATLSDVSDIALDSAGNMYIADPSNRRIRKVTPGGIITTFAGTGVQGASGDGGLAINATLNRPIAVALDYAGNLYICDSSNNTIRRVSLASGIITKYAGNGFAGFGGDGGQANSASLLVPLGVATDQSGNLYIADAGNNCIRKVSPGGVITTVAGTARAGFAGDGAAASAALLNTPSDVAVDASGSLFISDAGNNRLRKVDGLSGIISTIAGGDSNGFSGDGGPPANSMLNFPWGITIDAAGSLYVSDRANNRVRKISGFASPGLPLPAPVAVAVSAPRVTSLTPPTATGNAQHYSLQIDDAGGYQDLDVVNLLINSSLDGRQACYLAYSRPSNVLYLVPDAGGGLLPGMLLNGSGTLSNSQCIVAGAGSSAAGSGNTLTLTLNLNFTSAFAGDRVVYAAARSLTQNSGWQTMGVLGIPPLPSGFPIPTGLAPSSGSAANATMALTFQDASSALNLQTGWALINNALDGRSACYIAYYRPGNLVLLFPDNGDPSQATSMTLSGSNTVTNSQCTVSAVGSSVAVNGSQLTVNLNIAFKPAFGGFKAVWMAVQTIGNQTSPWRPLGQWQVPSN